jgi:hypothetical protein
VKTASARRRALDAVIPVLLSSLLVAQAAVFNARKSITYDETFYLAAALQTVADERLDPRLATWGVAPLPVLLDYLVPALGHGGEQRQDLWKGEPEDPALVSLARRSHVVVVGSGLVALVYFWLLARRGRQAAAIGGTLLVFSPSVIAHSSIATTDATVTLCVLLALAALDRYARRPGAASFAITAVTLALAIAAKYSALFLLPLAGLWLAVPRALAAASASPRAILGALVRAAGVFVLLLCTVGPLTWALHGFALAEPLTPRTPRAQRDPSARWPAPLVGIRSQIDHQSKGHPSFLRGQRSNHGWPSYYPIAFAMKSTPAELLLLLTALGLAIVRVFRAEATHFDATRWLWGITIVLYAGLAIASSVSIGHRHLLLLYPLIVLWSVDLLWEHGRRWSRATEWAAGALVVLQLVSAVRIAPSYLAYFNAASGGPDHAYRVLVDSNLDWGQDLVALREQLEKVDSRCAVLDYFGTADPRGYEVPAVKLGWSTQADLERCDHLAVSVTKLQEVYRRKPGYEQLRELPEQARAGHSIFLYELSRLPEELKQTLVERSPL